MKTTQQPLQMEIHQVKMQHTVNRFYQASFGLLIVLVLMLMSASSVQAQNRPNYGGGYNNDHRYAANEVIMYSECGFRGQAKAVRVGEHSKIDNLGFRNDDLSSIQIPDGLEVIIYEDSKFRGAFARLNQDVECFDRSWDNAVSSIRVNATGGAAYTPGYPRPGRQNPNVTPNNLSFVQFANSDLRRGNGNTWYLGARGQYDSLTEFRLINQDATSLFMDSVVSRERIRVDLSTYRVTYYSNNGLAQEYPIQEAEPGPVADRPHHNPVPTPAAPRSEPSRRISGQCFDYRAYTRGGDGGLRFHGKNNVEKFTTRPVTGRVCHSGAITMEITKTSPGTEVIVEIQGRQFKFDRNEPETRFENNWYRKDVRLVVGG